MLRIDLYIFVEDENDIESYKKVITDKTKANDFVKSLLNSARGQKIFLGD